MCPMENLKDVMKKSIFRCAPDDTTLDEKSMAVHPGTVLLTEKSLMKALKKKYNYFHQDIAKYFYDATLHWKL